MNDQDENRRLTAFQVEVSRLFFSLPASRDFLLAGGAALLAQHLTARPTLAHDTHAVRRVLGPTIPPRARSGLRRPRPAARHLTRPVQWDWSGRSAAAPTSPRYLLFLPDLGAR